MRDPEAWRLLRWLVVSGICPALFLLCLVMGLVWRRRSPVWLPVVAALALAAMLARLWLPFTADILSEAFTLVVSTWFLLAIACLAIAVVATAQDRRWRGVPLVTGLVLPAPLLALFFVYFLEDFAAL